MSRRASLKTLYRRQRAWDNQAAAIAALGAGKVLTLSNRTDTATGTVHAATALKLVREGYAVYLDDWRIGAGPSTPRR